MKILNNETNLKRLILLIYITVTMIEIIAEIFFYKPFLFIFKPLISIVLMILYWNISKQRNPLFFLVIFFSLITNIFFIYKTETMLFLGLITFFIHRLLIIYYIIKLIELKDFIPLFIATIPFLFFFFYLLTITTGLTTKSYVILIFQNILISTIAGITLADFIMNNSNKNTTWLFIFGILSITQYFIVFIEKYYLSELSPIIFRPIAMILNASVYFAFYKFVVALERLNDN